MRILRPERERSEYNDRVMRTAFQIRSDLHDVYTLEENRRRSYSGIIPINIGKNPPRVRPEVFGEDVVNTLSRLVAPPLLLRADVVWHDPEETASRQREMDMIVVCELIGPAVRAAVESNQDT
jgi:hypothetical protein